jgi:hypothetical protein
MAGDERLSLKTKTSQTPVPIPASLAAELSVQIARYGLMEPC